MGDVAIITDKFVTLSGTPASIAGLQIIGSSGSRTGPDRPGDIVHIHGDRPLDVILIDVLPAGRKVSVTGTADLRLAGQTAEILLDGKAVGTAAVGADGGFAARVRRPSRKRLSRARYQVRVGSAASQKLKLQRRMVATTLTRSGDVLTLRGRVTKPFARRAALIGVDRFMSCSRREKVAVAKTRPNRRGVFAVKIPVPAGAVSAIYRASTKVAIRKGRKPTFPTFTLPRAIDLG